MQNLNCKLVLKFTAPRRLLLQYPEFTYDLETVSAVANKIYSDLFPKSDLDLYYPVWRAIYRDAFSWLDKTWKNIGMIEIPSDLLLSNLDIETGTYYAKLKFEERLIDGYEVTFFSEATLNIPIGFKLYHTGTHHSWGTTLAAYIVRPMMLLDCDGTVYDKNIFRVIAKYSGQAERRSMRIAIAREGRNSLVGELATKDTQTPLAYRPELIIPYFASDFYYDSDKNRYISGFYRKISISNKPVENGYYRVLNKDRVLIVLEKVSDLY